MASTNSEVWQFGTVIETNRGATDIQRMMLEPSWPRKAGPSSHVDLKVIIEGEEHKRSYSIVESAPHGKRLVITVLNAPQSRGGSVFMHQLEVGDSLEITQPMQNFPLRVDAERYVLLAASIGITAIVNMAQVLKNMKAKYTFVYAGRNSEAMAYLPELQQLHGQNLVVRIDDDNTLLDVDELVDSADMNTELYMCGPIRLIDVVRRAWIERELNLPNLRYETFGNSGWHDPEDFIDRIPRLDSGTKVCQGRSMIEALEEAGVEMTSDCRKGECGALRGQNPSARRRHRPPRCVLQ